MIITKKENTFSPKLFQALGLLIGSLLYAISLHVFTIPAKLAPGGISGLASIFQIVMKIPASYSIFFLNLPILILGFIFLPKIFCAKSLMCVLLSSFLMQVMRMGHFYEFHVEDALLPTIAGGILNGAGIGLILLSGGSTAGTDIIGMIIKKKISNIAISRILFLINLLIISIGGILYFSVLKMELTVVISILIYSILQVSLNAKAVDLILNGFSSSVKFEVITTKHEELRKALYEKLGRSITTLHSKGGYTRTEFHLVICVVTKMQVTTFKKILKEIDPNAFCIVTNTREVLGSGFAHRR